MKPYTYMIGWRSLDTWYYGVRYSKDCDPADLWNPYRTSSKRVAEFIKLHGEPDVVRVMRVFDDRKKACEHEVRFLTRIDAPRNPRFLNRSKMNNSDAEKIGFEKGYKPKPEWVAKILQKRQEAVAAGWKRPPVTDETRKKLSKPKNQTPEHKAKLRANALKNLEKIRSRSDCQKHTRDCVLPP